MTSNCEEIYFLAHDDTLYHFGVKGQRWGQRRYQNKDGSLTPKGRQRRKNEKAISVAKKGRRYAQKFDSKKMTTIVSATAAIASGALWAASAFVPGGAGITFVRGSLSAVSAALNLADSLTPPPKHSSRK